MKIKSQIDTPLGVSFKCENDTSKIFKNFE